MPMYKDDLILIEQYLGNSLSEIEKESVDQRLLIDDDFKDLFQFIKDTQGAIKEGKKQEFIKELELIESKYHSSEDKAGKVISMAPKQQQPAAAKQDGGIITMTFSKTTLIAASVVLFFGMFSIVYFNKNITNNNIYSDIDSVRKIYKESNSEVKDKPVYSKEINNLGSAPNSSIKGMTKFNIPVIILKDNRYPNHYFLKDTLYLFGSFGENLILTIDSNFLNLREGFKNYTIEYIESTKIEELKETKLFNK